MNTKLCNIKRGETARITQIEDCPIFQRLVDIGLTVGTDTECVGRSPSGGMGAYKIRGAVIALRDRDCESVTVERCKKWD